MFKFFAISLILHLFLFLKFSSFKTLGDPQILTRENVPISFISIKAQYRVDSFKKIKGAEEKLPDTNQKIERSSDTTENKKKHEKEIIKKDNKNNSKIKDNKKTIKNDPVMENPKKSSIENTENNSKNNNDNKKHTDYDGDKLGNDEAFLKGGNFTVDSAGTYTALSSQGINFEIINQYDPEYPRQAEIIRYNKAVVVEARFLVNLDGKVENIQITKSHSKFGFDQAVIDSLKKWKFKPIVHNGKKIKVFFVKEFVFSPKS